MAGFFVRLRPHGDENRRRGGDRCGASALGFDDRSEAQGEGARRSRECEAPAGGSQSPWGRQLKSRQPWRLFCWRFAQRSSDPGGVCGGRRPERTRRSLGRAAMPRSGTNPRGDANLESPPAMCGGSRIASPHMAETLRGHFSARSLNRPCQSWVIMDCRKSEALALIPRDQPWCSE